MLGMTRFIVNLTSRSNLCLQQKESNAASMRVEVAAGMASVHVYSNAAVVTVIESTIRIDADEGFSNVIATVTTTTMRTSTVIVCAVSSSSSSEALAFYSTTTQQHPSITTDRQKRAHVP